MWTKNTAVQAIGGSVQIRKCTKGKVTGIARGIEGWRITAIVRR